MGLELRWTAADDPVLAPLVADLAREYDARYAPTDGVPSSAELTRYPPAAFAEASGGAFLAVLEEGALVAGGALKRGRSAGGAPLAEVKRMWTRGDRRRRGLARLVLGALEVRAAELGYAGIELTTGARQPGAVGLYLAEGWAPDFDPRREQDAGASLRFTKALPSAP